MVRRTGPASAAPRLRTCAVVSIDGPRESPPAGRLPARVWPGHHLGMAERRTKKITVTVPVEIAEQLAQVGAPNVSAWVTEAVTARMRREADLARWHEAIGGPPPAEALEWARRSLGVVQQQAS